MFPNFEALAKDGSNPIITFFHLLLRRNSHASQGVKAMRFDGSRIVADDGPVIRSALLARNVEIAAVEKCRSSPSLPPCALRGPTTRNAPFRYMQDLGSASYTKHYIGRDMLTVSNDSVARYRTRVWCCDVHGDCKSNVFGFTMLAEPPQRVNVFPATCFAASRTWCSALPTKQACSVAAFCPQRTRHLWQVR